MSRSIFLFTVSLVFAAALSGQKTELRVDDLLGATRLGGFVQEEAPRPDWIHRQQRPGTEGVSSKGEGLLLEDSALHPWLEPDELVSIVRALGHFRDGIPEVSGGTLLVEGTDAASAVQALTQLRRQLPPRVRLDLRVERIGESSSKTLFRTRQVVRAGSTLTFADIENHRVLRDFDVEIAQSASEANPIVGDLTMGTCLALRPRVLPGRDELFVELFTRVASPAEAPKIEPTKLGMFAIDRAARELCESGIAMRMPRGANRSVRWTAVDGGQLRVTVSASFEDPKPVPKRGAIVRCRGLFHKGVAEFRTDVPEPDEKSPAFAAEAAFRRAGAEKVEVIAGDHSAMAALVVRGAKAEQIDADVSARLSRSLRSAELEITLFDVPAGVDPAAAGDKGKTIAQIRSPVIVGKSVAFSGRTELRYVRDWDVEVAQSSRIADPKVDVMHHGYHVDARVLNGVDGRLEGVAVDAKVSRLDRIDRKKAKISFALRGGGVPSEGGSVSPTIVLPEEVVIVESPVLRSHVVSTVLRVDANGEATLRRAAPRLLGEGRDLIVVVRVGK